MSNPFKYGGIVLGDDFCNRKQEQHDIINAVNSGEKLFIYSERRYGKTSLIKQVISTLPKKNYITIYVDIWPIDNDFDFIKNLAKRISESISDTPDKLLNTAKKFFSSLVPSITIDAEGKPAITFGVKEIEDSIPELEKVLKIPEKIAIKKKVLIVFDEFQQLLIYGLENIERTMRSIIQTQGNISYIFLGSRKYLIQKMFLDSSRPLFRSAGHYPLKSIKMIHWKSFIKNKFYNTDRKINDDVIEKLIHLTEGHPFYTQHLCHTIWDLCEKGEDVTDVFIDKAVTILLEREKYAYTTLWESLTLNQRLFLKGLAKSTIIKPFSSEFIKENKLKTPSNAQRASEGLIKMDIIDHENGNFIILDRFFKLWIKRL